MSLLTEGLLLHTFCGIRSSFQVISHGLVREVARAWSLSNEKLETVRRTSRGLALLRDIVCRQCRKMRTVGYFYFGSSSKIVFVAECRTFSQNNLIFYGPEVIAVYS